MNARLLLILLLAATAAGATPPTVQQKMAALCEFSRSSLPSSPPICTDAARVAASTDVELTNAMDEFWNHWTVGSSTGASVKVAFERKLLDKYPPVYKQGDLKSASAANLCSMVRRKGAGHDAAAYELTRRNLLTADELRAVEQQRIAIGMSQQAMLCSWGGPERRNRTVTAAGEKIQWIYGSTYVYTNNGVIVSYQD